MSRWFQETDTIGDIAKAYRTMKKEQIWEKMEIYVQYQMSVDNVLLHFPRTDMQCLFCRIENAEAKGSLT